MRRRVRGIETNEPSSWAIAAACAGAAACRSPTVTPAELSPDGGPGASGTTISGDAGGETIGIAPACTDADPAKMAVGATVAVPAGTFTMGCNASVDNECKADESPAHPVSLDAFAIQTTEVTQAQYLACVKDGKCTFPKCPWDPCTAPDLPIACVKHAQAAGYCAWAAMRLPTEAEWERAARGDDGRKYPWGNDPLDCDRANFVGCGATVAVVGRAPQGASPFGALDMAGNVVEWVSDYYDPGYYGVSPPSAPKGPDNGDSFSGRGGGFLSDETWERASARDLYDPGYTRVSMGFRCAK